MSTEEIVLYAAIFLIGASVGSFLNVCIYRLPRGKSIVTPSSRCPSCGTPILALDNIPILSYLILRGRCRACGERISPRYPFVEALSGALYVAVLWRLGMGWQTPLYLVFVSALIVITFIDLDYQIIPDGISIPGTAVGIAAGMFILNDPFGAGERLGVLNTFLGAALGFGLYYIIAVASRGGMGGGDIKLMAMIGAFLGWKGVLMTTFAGSLLGSVVGVFLMVVMGKGRKTKIPFGPFLAVGALISLFTGREVLNWYLG